MRRFVAVLALTSSLFLLTDRAEAQQRRDRGRDRGLVEMEPASLRGGFFIGGGFGAGREQFKFSDEEEFTEPLTKPTITLRLGGTPDSYVRVGAEVFAWATETATADETFGTMLGVVQFYPMRDAGLWLKGGAGFAVSASDSYDPSFFDVSETGFGWSIGAGYEFQLSRSFAIGPSVELYQGTFEQRDEPSLTERVLNIGAQITFQTGGRRR